MPSSPLHDPALLAAYALLAAAVGTLVSIQMHTHEPPAPANKHFQIPAGMARAIDGDTIAVPDRERTVRLARIDAPELSTGALGEASKAFLNGALSAGPLECRVLRVDYYGRDLAECTINSQNVSDVMLQLGKARPYSSEESFE